MFLTHYFKAQIAISPDKSEWNRDSVNQFCYFKVNNISVLLYIFSFIASHNGINMVYL
jgi:hypothetical protein